MGKGFESMAYPSAYLQHYGTKGQRWGIRNYQNPDGSLTPAGRAHYGYGDGRQKEGSSNSGQKLREGSVYDKLDRFDSWQQNAAEKIASKLNSSANKVYDTASNASDYVRNTSTEQKAKDASDLITKATNTVYDQTASISDYVANTTIEQKMDDVDAWYRNSATGVSDWLNNSLNKLYDSHNFGKTVDRLNESAENTMDYLSDQISSKYSQLESSLATTIDGAKAVIGPKVNDISSTISTGLNVSAVNDSMKLINVASSYKTDDLYDIYDINDYDWKKEDYIYDKSGEDAQKAYKDSTAEKAVEAGYKFLSDYQNNSNPRNNVSSTHMLDTLDTFTELSTAQHLCQQARNSGNEDDADMYDKMVKNKVSTLRSYGVDVDSYLGGLTLGKEAHDSYDDFDWDATRSKYGAEFDASWKSPYADVDFESEKLPDSADDWNDRLHEIIWGSGIKEGSSVKSQSTVVNKIGKQISKVSNKISSKNSHSDNVTADDMKNLKFDSNGFLENESAERYKKVQDAVNKKYGDWYNSENLSQEAAKSQKELASLRDDYRSKKLSYTEYLDKRNKSEQQVCRDALQKLGWDVTPENMESIYQFIFQD